MKLGRFVPLAAAAAVVSVATLVQAAVTFDHGSGTGFVGKGDVQLVYGWNNRELNDYAGKVDFRVKSQIVTERSWECSNGTERSRTTTSTIRGVLSNVARQNNNSNVTGFNLRGYDSISQNNSTNSGSALDSCPGAGNVLVVAAGDPVEVDRIIEVDVRYDSGAWERLNYE
jgi:hypothetical protein